jgi:hypothetical protein
MACIPESSSAASLPAVFSLTVLGTLSLVINGWLHDMLEGLPQPNT